MYLTKSIIRGDNSNLSWQVTGQIGAGNIFFTAKRNYSLTSDRLIDAQGTSNYDSLTNITSIDVALNSGQTQNIIFNALVYDVTLIDSAGEETTLARGELKIKFDARTPYDGTPIAPEKYVPVKRSTFTDGQYVKAISVNGVIEFQGYTSLKNSLFDFDISGDLMPAVNIDLDDVYELDTNGDIMPRGVI